MHETKEIIRQVRNIEITTKELVDGLLTGNYHSVFKGQGIEFSEIRDYRPGDDIRAIDWNVTARFNHPYIKEFIEERDLRVYFAFDFSASGSFGNHKEKRRKAIELAAALMFSAQKNNDNIGSFIFTNDVEKHVPARKGKKHLLKMIGVLLTHKAQEKTTNLAQSLTHIANILKKRSVLFIISDFYSEEYTKPLARLRNKHDVIAIQVRDKREKHIPDVGLIQLEDEETGEQLLVDTSDEEFRKNYENIVKKQHEHITKTFKKHKIDSIELLTDESYDTPLKKFFKTRKRKVIS